MFYWLKSRLSEALLLALMLLCVTPVVADDLGEFILTLIKNTPEQPLTEGAMLLLTRDLGWYEKHM
ncbi:MAG: hypothetical protein OQL20_09120, partial [Sedimenticola sp.]|nr:hypothetical protein [Sedimenticola sp.]